MIDPNSPNTMLLGSNAGGGVLFRSTNGGTTFTRLPVGGIDESFRAIAFSPKTGSSVAFAFSNDFINLGQNGAIYKSADNGVSWSSLKNQPTVAGDPSTHPGRGRAIVIDTTGMQIAAPDAGYGIFYRANQGTSWVNSLPKSSARIYALSRPSPHL